MTGVPLGCLAIVGRAKASMHFTIRVEWQRKDGTTPTAELVTTDHSPCESGGDVGLKLAEAKRIVAWLQEIVVKEQCRFSLIRFFLKFGAGPALEPLAAAELAEVRNRRGHTSDA